MPMELLKDRYPREVTCRKGLTVTIRPITPEEVPLEIELYQKLDNRDKAKLPNDLGDENYVSKMLRWMEDGRAYTLAAWHENEIIGELTLYRGMNSWVRHTGDVVLLTHPQYRRYGIATALFDEMIPVADALQLDKLYANMVEEHKEAIKLLTTIGFSKEAVLKDHIRDTYGRHHDLNIYSMDMEAAHRAMEDLMSRFNDYSG